MQGLADMMAMQMLLQQNRQMPGMGPMFGQRPQQPQPGSTGSPQALDPDPFGYGRMQMAQTRDPMGTMAGGGGGGDKDLMKDIVKLMMLL